MFLSRHSFVASAAALSLTAGIHSSASALIVDYTGSVDAGWEYGDWVATPGADGLVISSAVDGQGGQGDWIAGGGVAADVADHVFVTAKLNAGNLSTSFSIRLTDIDAGGSDNFEYDVDTSLLNATTFTTLDLGSLTSFVRTSSDGGDGIVNATLGAGIQEMSIEGYNGDGIVSVTVASVEVAAVPEPASLVLLSAGGLALLRRRRA